MCCGEAGEKEKEIVPRALSIFSIIDILMGIPSGSLCGGERYFCVCKYARVVKQKVWNEAENRERDLGRDAFLSPHTPY